MTVIKLLSLNSILSRWNNQRAIPIKIPILDDTIGGLLHGHIHSVYGDSGVGKTIFCFRAIHYLFQQRNDARILYSDFNGHLRISNLKKMITEEKSLDQIEFFKPKSFTEQIIFFRNLTEDLHFPCDLIILDTFFGSPLDAIDVLTKNQRLWKKRIYNHLLDLKHIAEKWNIPILLTNHLKTSKDGFNSESDREQYGNELLNLVVPISLLIYKQELKHKIEFRLFQDLVSSTEFPLVILQ